MLVLISCHYFLKNIAFFIWFTGDEDKEQAEVVDEEEEEEYHTDEDEPIEESDADEALDLVLNSFSNGFTFQFLPNFN